VEQLLELQMSVDVSKSFKAYLQFCLQNCCKIY